jgi:protein ImuA
MSARPALAAVHRSAPIQPVGEHAIWCAADWATHSLPCQPSGHAALDALLPGGGWPAGQLMELHQPQRMHAEWRLLLPALRSASLAGRVLLINPPHTPNLQALQAQGLHTTQLMVVDTPHKAHIVWSVEQALRCPDVRAVVAWLPQSSYDMQRRLHLAALASRSLATAAMGGPARLWVWRAAEQRHMPSPAALRLHVCSRGWHGLRVDVFKRKGAGGAATVDIEAPLPVGRLWPRSSDGVSVRPFLQQHVVDRPARLAA